MKDYSKTIETERLILRKFTIDDAEDIYNYASREEVTKYLSFQTYKSVQDGLDYLNNIVLPAYEKENTYKWALELKETGRVIGCIDCVNVNLKRRSVELGWVLLNDYWGQGLMPEAGKTVIKYLFEEGFERIEAYHNVENEKSGRVMQKIGMTYEGTLRKSRVDKNGNLVDCKLYAVIK